MFALVVIAGIAMALRCYKVRSLSFIARKPCGVLEKYFSLKDLHDEDCACFRPGWVAGESRDGAMCDGPIMRCFAMVFAFLANFAF